MSDAFEDAASCASPSKVSRCSEGIGLLTFGFLIVGPLLSNGPRCSLFCSWSCVQVSDKADKKEAARISAQFILLHSVG